MRILFGWFVITLATSLYGQTTFGQNSPNGTVFIGDSITAFGNAPETQPDQSYGWGWTAQAVFLSGGRIQQLYNAGGPGQTAAQIAARFPTDVVPYNPGTVVIMAGTNDATSGAYSLTALNATIASIGSMVTQAKAAGIQPILCTIPPRADAGNYNLNVSKINAAIQKLAQAQRVLLVDFNSILVDPTTGVFKSGYDAGDGIHPSATAAKAMAQYFVTATANLYGPSQEFVASTGADNTVNLIPNPLFLTSTAVWSSNSYGTSPTPTFSTVADPSITGNWLSVSLPSGTAPGQFYAVNGPTVLVTQGHHMAYSFKFQITGLEATYSRLNMGYAYGASNFTYGYLTDTSGTFYIEFTAPASTFVPGFALAPSVTAGTITLKISQMSLVDLTAVGY